MDDLTTTEAIARTLWINGRALELVALASNHAEWQAMHLTTQEVWMWHAALVAAALESVGFEVRKKADNDADWRPNGCGGGCGASLMRWWKFCPACGRRVRDGGDHG